MHSLHAGKRRALQVASVVSTEYSLVQLIEVIIGLATNVLHGDFYQVTHIEVRLMPFNQILTPSFKSYQLLYTCSITAHLSFAFAAFDSKPSSAAGMVNFGFEGARLIA